MQKQKLPKWLKLYLPIALGVVLVTGLVAYSSNPEMFQGYLRTFRPVTMTDQIQLKPAAEITTPTLKEPVKELPDLEPVVPEMPVITPPPKNPTPLPLPLPADEPSDQCKLIKQYLAEGTLTANLGSDLSPYNDCVSQYPDYMQPPTSQECETLKGYFDAGTLSDMVANGQVDYADNLMCANRFPYMWHNLTPPENFCGELRAYFEQGLLSDMIADGSISEYENVKCAQTYTDAWHGNNPSERECQIYLELRYQGLLTSTLNGDDSRADICANKYFDEWHSKPDLADCKTMKQIEDDGQIGEYLSNGTYSFNEYLACGFYYPSMWNDQNPTENYCLQLKYYMEQGTLTEQLLGDISDAEYCADNYPNIWSGDEEPVVTTNCKGFVDVPPGSKYYDAVEYMVDQGWTSYDQAGCKFRPEDGLNRAEGAKLMIVGFDLPLVTEATQIFPDVEPNSWFYDYVSTVYKNGIMKGYDDGTFKPANNVVRAEMFKMFMEAYQGKEASFTLPTLEQSRKACPDFMAEEQDRWYVPYMVEAKVKGLLGNDPCRGADYATRGDFAAMFYYVSQL